jgi:iron(III) transport system permease protein
MRQLLYRWPVCFGVLLIGGLVGWPLLLLLAQSVFPNLLDGRLDGFLEPYRAMVTTEGIGGMLWNSFAWAACTTAISIVVGLPCGWLLARAEFAGKCLARLLLIVPLMTPPYIGALSYVLVMQPAGFADQWFGGIPEGLRAWFFSFWGVSFVMAMMSFAYVALAVDAALRAIPSRLEDAANLLGAGRYTTFARVTLPLLTPALVNSGLIVFLECLSNFGVPAILGPRANLPLLPAEIYYLVTSWPVDLPLATSLSTLLCLVAFVSLIAGQRAMARFQSSGGRTTVVRTVRLRGAHLPWAWGFLGCLFVAAAVVPYFAMVLTSLVDHWDADGPVLTLRHYTGLFAGDSTGRAALWTSLWLSAAAASICCILGGFTAYAISRFPGGLTRLLDGLALMPRVLPKIVLVIGLIMAWNAPWMKISIYNTVWMLLLAYVALTISDALRFSDTALRQISERLEHAAGMLGARRLRIFMSIVLPLLKPALGATWVTTFLVCMRELVASIILLPPGVETTATFIFNQFEQGEIGSAMAMASLTIVVSTAILAATRLRGNTKIR